MGSYLPQPNKQKNISQGNFSHLSYCSLEMQGWRKTMEDSTIHEATLGNGNSLFAVFDGHGGSQVSECLKQIFVDVLKQTEEYEKREYPKALDITFKKIDEFLLSEEGQVKLKEIQRKQEKEENGQNKIGNKTGCTANVVLITENIIYVANAGDCRSVLYRNGETIILSQEHKPNKKGELMRIQKAGGNVKMGRVNSKLNLSRSFGDFKFKKNKDLPYDEQMITCKPDIKEIDRHPKDDFILIGCDGVWERYYEESSTLMERIKKQMQEKQKIKIMEDILDEMLATDPKSVNDFGCDNMTAILIKFK